MKAKWLIAAALVVVLCIGILVMLGNKPEQEDSSSSAVVEPAATEEPVESAMPTENEESSEADPTAAEETTVEDKWEVLKNIYITSYVEAGGTQEDAEEMGQKYIEKLQEEAKAKEAASDESTNEVPLGKSEEDQKLIAEEAQHYMEKYGMSAEEARKEAEITISQMREHEAKADKIKQEISDKRATEQKAIHDQRVANFEAATGTSYDDYLAMSNADKAKFIASHPELKGLKF